MLARWNSRWESSWKIYMRHKRDVLNRWPSHWKVSLNAVYIHLLLRIFIFFSLFSWIFTLNISAACTAWADEWSVLVNSDVRLARWLVFFDIIAKINVRRFQRSIIFFFYCIDKRSFQHVPPFRMKFVCFECKREIDTPRARRFITV